MANRNLSSVLITISVIGAIGLLTISCLWAFLYFGVYLGYGNYKVRGHQDFASNGVSQIEPAMQMDRIFSECRHSVTYGPNDVPLFNSVAYFGDRYVLTMQVPVHINSKTNGSMIGEPQFYLNEVGTVTISPSGQIGASFSRNLNFGATEWKRVFDAQGDFSTIGFNVNATPVANFQKFANASRRSN